MGNQLKTKKYQLNKNNVKRLPETAGVYIFIDRDGKPIYVGKAINLRARVRSYFSLNLATKTKRMINEAKLYTTYLVGSELEALLLEAKLVKKYKTKYNSSLKDDKHPIYIRITDEKYPRVLTARKSEENPPAGAKNLYFLGPFPSTSNVRGVLKLLRRIFPYSQHKLGKRGCLYSQMGLCKPCPNVVESMKDARERKRLNKEYRKNIIYISATLSGRFTFVRSSLERIMNRYSRREEYEAAGLVRDQINRLDYVTQPVTPVDNFLKNPNLLEDIRSEELKALSTFLSKYMNVKENLVRIECFDVAHLTGIKPTASMVTFIRGEPDKSFYRHFKIRQKKGMSDTDSMREVGIRREKYLSNWGIPDLIIVDGGKAQVGVFRRIFSKHKIPIIGLAKREEKIVITTKRYDLKTHSFLEIKLKRGPAKYLVQRLRDEAHRFARRYHHKLLQKELIPT